MTTATLARPTTATPSRDVLAKAETLFKAGYTAEITDRFIIVTNPEGRRYRLDPADGFCSCKWQGVCSHLLGVQRLLLDMALAIDDMTPDCRQDVPWGAYTELGLERRARKVELYDAAFATMIALEKVGIGL